jgi:3-(3-hydroxy-phenyl)propionate hydroxylase
MNRVFETPLYPYRRSPDQDRQTPAHRPTIVVGAGPVGLAAAIDLALHDVPVVVLDENDKVSWGSRAICFAKRPLEILDRLGCSQPMVDRGVQWKIGKIFFGDRQVYEFNLLLEGGHKQPAFINLQQYYFELHLFERATQLQAEGRPIEIRGGNRVVSINPSNEDVILGVNTPNGHYTLKTDWLIACDGAASPIRSMMKLDFVGRTFEDNFLIADIVMDPPFPAERWFWFDPPFNKGRSALLHKQPDNIWRIDLQLGWNINKEVESEPDRVISRLRRMLGEEIKFELEWVSIYTFQCRRMEKFRHGRVIFAGDAAHQVSPFGARGANSGLQDVDNLVWKLKYVIDGRAPDSLLDSYDFERILGADENILNSTRSTDFITPRSAASRLFRDAALDLAAQFPFARPLINSGRLSTPCVYDGSQLNGSDHPGFPSRTRPGTPAVDAPVSGGWLLDRLGGEFRLLAIETAAPSRLETEGFNVETIVLRTSDDESDALRDRYLGDQRSAIYLIRPDQHVAARWTSYNESQVCAALRRATGRPEACP